MKIGDKYFLNLQEAVAWLLANNALPFQCNVNYVANTEIAKTAIINPSPAEIKVGALVLFADSKIGTISGLTTNGFMVGSEYTDVKNALAYISAVNVDAGGVLTVTLSDGTIINAGKIKQVSSFSIDGSQHLIANYNDGTSTDLGAIFTGNVNIAGNLTANSIIENMAGYSFQAQTVTNVTYSFVYAGAVKNGNKLTFVFAVNITATADFGAGLQRAICRFFIPSAVGDALYPTTVGGASLLDDKKGAFIPSTDFKTIEEGVVYCEKVDSQRISFGATLPAMTIGDVYYLRHEVTFLLSDNLAS